MLTLINIYFILFLKQLEYTFFRGTPGIKEIWLSNIASELKGNRQPIAAVSDVPMVEVNPLHTSGESPELVLTHWELMVSTVYWYLTCLIELIEEIVRLWYKRVSNNRANTHNFLSPFAGWSSWLLSLPLCNHRNGLSRAKSEGIHFQGVFCYRKKGYL